MLITERSGRLRIVHQGVLDPEPIAGMPKVLDRNLKGPQRHRAAPALRREPLDLLHVLQASSGFGRPGHRRARPRHASTADTRSADVRDLFATDTATNGPSAARFVFGRDGKIYLAIGIPIPTTVKGVATTTDAQDPNSYYGKSPATERRWDGARRQSVRRAARSQAGVVRARHPQRDVDRGAPGYWRDLGNGEWSAGRRRAQHHQAWQELRLARHLARAIVQRRRDGRDRSGTGSGVQAWHGAAAALLGAVTFPVGHGVLHRRQVPPVERQHLHRCAGRRTGAGRHHEPQRAADSPTVAPPRTETADSRGPRRPRRPSVPLDR
jgi:hypothetical protein